MFALYNILHSTTISKGNRKIFIFISVWVLGGFAVGQGRAEETNNLTTDLSGYTEMSWPDTDMAHSIPTPASSTGSMYATEKTVVADVANTSEDSYNALPIWYTPPVLLYPVYY